MLLKRDKLFCEISPTTYAISRQKGIIVRHVRDLIGKEKFATKQQEALLPVVISENESNMIKRAPGVELSLQLGKAENIAIANRNIHKIIIKPNEVFSFWRRVGKLTKRNGYQEGRVIENNIMKPGYGGGLCNLANSIHLLILHSPLEVTEIHTHSDALAPDEGERVPFKAGTSISYNYIDYRFKNTTDQDFQLLMWCEGDMLLGELRSEKAIPYKYRLIEENHHFRKENEKYYRISKIYREVLDSKTDELIAKELIWDNRSEVMFDYNLIPKEQIRN